MMPFHLIRVTKSGGVGGQLMQLLLTATMLSSPCFQHLSYFKTQLFRWPVAPTSWDLFFTCFGSMNKRCTSVKDISDFPSPLRGSLPISHVHVLLQESTTCFSRDAIGPTPAQTKQH